MKPAVVLSSSYITCGCMYVPYVTLTSSPRVAAVQADESRRGDDCRKCQKLKLSSFVFRCFVFSFFNQTSFSFISPHQASSGLVQRDRRRVEDTGRHRRRRSEDGLWFSYIQTSSSNIKYPFILTD